MTTVLRQIRKFGDWLNFQLGTLEECLPPSESLVAFVRQK